MLPFENLVADYIEETENHVLYRATPVFEGDNLVASGVQLEGWSVEDEGEGVCFNVYCYNVQPGVTIDYATGDSRAADDTPAADTAAGETYVLNTRSKKYHLPDCPSVDSISSANRQGLHRHAGGAARRGVYALRPVHRRGLNRRGSTCQAPPPVVY